MRKLFRLFEKIQKHSDDVSRTAYNGIVVKFICANGPYHVYFTVQDIWVGSLEPNMEAMIIQLCPQHQQIVAVDDPVTKLQLIVCPGHFTKGMLAKLLVRMP